MRFKVRVSEGVIYDLMYRQGEVGEKASGKVE